MQRSRASQLSGIVRAFVVAVVLLAGGSWVAWPEEDPAVAWGGAMLKRGFDCAVVSPSIMTTRTWFGRGLGPLGPERSGSWIYLPNFLQRPTESVMVPRLSLDIPPAFDRLPEAVVEVVKQLDAEEKARAQHQRRVPPRAPVTWTWVPGPDGSLVAVQHVEDEAVGVSSDESADLPDGHVSSPVFLGTRWYVDELEVWTAGFPWRCIEHARVKASSQLVYTNAAEASVLRGPSFGVNSGSLIGRVFWLQLAGNLVVLTGAVLAFERGAAWLGRRLRHPPGTCRRCGYSRAGLGDGAACPECGRAVPGRTEA